MLGYHSVTLDSESEALASQSNCEWVVGQSLLWISAQVPALQHDLLMSLVASMEDFSECHRFSYALKRALIQQVFLHKLPLPPSLPLYTLRFDNGKQVDTISQTNEGTVSQ